jgi:bifunctional DNase/RNase
MDKDFIEVRVSGLAVAPEDGMPMVLLLDKEEKLGLSLPIGPAEASAIITELEGLCPPGPLTHDLLASVFREGGFSLERVELFGERASDATSRLVYRRGLSRRSRSLRPSDALALALRLEAPVYARRPLLASRREAEEAMHFAIGRAPAPCYYRCSPRRLSSS